METRADPFGTFNIPKRDIVVDHATSRDDSRCENLLSVVGIKYTTARAVASGVIDTVEARLRGRASRSKSETEKLLGAAFDSLAELKGEIRASLPETVSNTAIEELARDFGSNYRVITERFSQSGAADDAELLRARVRCAVELEDAVSLGDVLLRRTDSATIGAPSRAAVELIADELHRMLGWSPEAMRAESASFLFPRNSYPEAN
jgi:glycerol-3-phosphate dehydrogenase